MRLVHLTTVAETLTFFRGQVEFLNRHGFDVHAIAGRSHNPAQLGPADRVTFHEVPLGRVITPFRDAVSLLRIVTLLRRLRPDIVHAHTPKAGLLGMIAASLVRVPVRIFHIHGLPHVTARSYRRTILQWSTRISCALAHRVLCVSASVREIALEEGLCRASKLSVPANGSIGGIDADERFNPARFTAEDRAQFRLQFGLPPGAPVVGFIGRIVRDKGISELVDAWKSIARECPSARLLIVGGFEEHDPLPERTRRALQQCHGVQFTGWRDDTPQLLAALDIVVLPSHREGFPVVPLEAAAMALPVIAANVPGSRDAVKHGVTGTLIPVQDSAALASALRTYIERADLRHLHGLAARERALKQFKPAAVFEATLREYEQLYWKRNRGCARAVVKRCIDIAVASTALVCLLPVIVAAAVLVRVLLGSPVLFRQKRPGSGERLFTILKFRTMRDAADRNGRPLPDSERLTPFGRLLRRCSIDELPQLWNVLKGDMSLVGPRPLLPEYIERYDAVQRRRHEVKPGLTGWAQVNGRNEIDWGRKFELDVWYVDHWNLKIDTVILLKTLWNLIRRAGVSHGSHVTMPAFAGNPADDAAEVSR